MLWTIIALLVGFVAGWATFKHRVMLKARALGFEQQLRDKLKIMG